MAKKTRRKPAGEDRTTSPTVAADNAKQTGKKKKAKASSRPENDQEDGGAFTDAPADTEQESLVETDKSAKKKKTKSKRKKAIVVQSASEHSTDEESGGGSDDNDGTYRSRNEPKSKVAPKPHVRTQAELDVGVCASTLHLARKWSYKPGRSVDNNVILSEKPGHDWENSHIYGRNKDPITLLQRISDDAGVVADVDSWLNICQRDHASHESADNDQEAECPTYEDLQAFMAHCDYNKDLVAKGEKPVSLMEIPGFEPGTIFTSRVVNLGRDALVPFYVNKDGGDSAFIHFQLVLSNKAFCRKHHIHGYVTYSIAAYLAKLRRQHINDSDFWINGSLPTNDNIYKGSVRLYNYAIRNGWLRPATKAEIQKLVQDGVLESATCAKADMLRGIQATDKKGKKGKEPFFTLKDIFPHTAPTREPGQPEPVRPKPMQSKPRTLAETRAAARPVTPPLQKRPRHTPKSPASGADSPPRPKKKVRQAADIPPGVVTELPLRVQELISERPIRPKLERVRIDGMDKWVLPEWWTKNIPANAHAPVEFAIANSLYPRQTVAALDGNTPDNAVAGPGPRTAMTLRNRKKAKA